MGLIFAALAVFAAVAMRRKSTPAETVDASAGHPTVDSSTSTDPLTEVDDATTPSGGGAAPFQLDKGKKKFVAKKEGMQTSLLGASAFTHCFTGLTDQGAKDALLMLLSDPDIHWDQLLKLHFEYLASNLPAAAGCLLQAAKERLIATCAIVTSSGGWLDSRPMMRSALNNPAVSSSTLEAAAAQLDPAAAACLRAWSALFFPSGQAGTSFPEDL